MGMGEPLNNYTASVEAIHVMTGSPFQLSPKRITVSTVIPPKFVLEAPNLIALLFSLISSRLGLLMLSTSFIVIYRA
ncbi:hypothetical protein V6N13_134568 [Hibiscus sabdariffa]|uniref:Uncharacterized protein n=1 Tax=Hibiscus sabdariffa TaxID=183260 RepID=A0ABR2R4N6_9ROSI